MSLGKIRSLAQSHVTYKWWTSIWSQYVRFPRSHSSPGCSMTTQLWRHLWQALKFIVPPSDQAALYSTSRAGWAFRERWPDTLLSVTLPPTSGLVCSLPRGSSRRHTDFCPGDALPTRKILVSPARAEKLWSAPGWLAGRTGATSDRGWPNPGAGPACPADFLQD